MLKQTVIIGAGISGLALAWRLKQKNMPLTVLEASSRPGGWIESLNQDDFFFEQGPRSFRPWGTGMATLQLLEELGMQEEVIFANESAKIRHLFTGNTLQRMPTGVAALLTSPYLPIFFKAWLKDTFASKSNKKDESIYEFAERRFGRVVADQFFDPLVSGIFAGDIKKLSIRSCFPRLYELENQYRSLWFGMFQSKRKAPLTPFIADACSKGIFTLKHGIQSLTDRLAHNLKNELRLNAAVKSLSFSKGLTTMTLQNGETIKAHQTFLAIPPKQAFPLFKTDYPRIAEQLASFQTASLAVLNFGYHSQVLNKKGFGYLIPSQEKQKILGVVWDSSVFPQQNKYENQTRLTAMMGGAHDPDFLKHSESELTEIALNELEKHLGIKQRPDFIHVKIADEAIPQYLVGHYEKLEALKLALEQLPGKVTVLGNGYYGISVNDCIAHAQSLTP